jgi:hypothetical protein
METTATIALVGLAVMVAASLLAAYPQTIERLEAHEDVLLALEATVEGLRSGALDLGSGPVDPEIRGRRPVEVELEVVTSPQPGLWLVTATGRATVRGREVVRTLHTQIWRPS